MKITEVESLFTQLRKRDEATKAKVPLHQEGHKPFGAYTKYVNPQDCMVIDVYRTIDTVYSSWCKSSMKPPTIRNYLRHLLHTLRDVEEIRRLFTPQEHATTLSTLEKLVKTADKAANDYSKGKTKAPVESEASDAGSETNEVIEGDAEEEAGCDLDDLSPAPVAVRGVSRDEELEEELKRTKLQLQDALHAADKYKAQLDAVWRVLELMNPKAS